MFLSSKSDKFGKGRDGNRVRARHSPKSNLGIIKGCDRGLCGLEVMGHTWELRLAAAGWLGGFGNPPPSPPPAGWLAGAPPENSQNT